MDFSNRGGQPHPGASPASDMSAAGAGPKTKKGRDRGGMSKLAGLIVLFGVAILIVALILLLVFGKSGQTKYLNTKDYQAVDISVGGSSGGDQIYFGQIKDLSDQYVVLQNVYYIPASTSSTSNITLEPLVCQIDEPFDQMIVNSSSVNWWENLQSSSQVVKSITSYEKSATSSTACPQTSSSTQSSTGSSSTTPASSTSSTTK